MADPAESCVFCKIVAGQIPSSRVYEDEHCVAFLDIGPLAPGHLLVVPRQHAERLWDLDEATAAAIGARLAILTKAVVQATGAEGCNVLQNNGSAAQQEVAHAHYHVIPRRSGDGLGFRWRAGSYEPGQMETVQQEIRRQMG